VIDCRFTTVRIYNLGFVFVEDRLVAFQLYVPGRRHRTGKTPPTTAVVYLGRDAAA
jgi:hypothetical protein